MLAALKPVNLPHYQNQTVTAGFLSISQATGGSVLLLCNGLFVLSFVFISSPLSGYSFKTDSCLESRM